MTRTSKILLWLTAAALCLCAIAFFAWRHFRPRMESIRLAPRSETSVPRSVLPAEVIYRQRDPRWVDDKIGGTGSETLGDVGCTVCCVAMALAEHGIVVTPKELNRQLSESGGFTPEGLLKWDAVAAFSGRKVAISIPPKPTHQDIDTALASGNPVLVKVLLGSTFQHWVLLVGREGQEYLMKDPLGSGVSVAPLTSLRSDIFAVRIVRKAAR